MSGLTESSERATNPAGSRTGETRDAGMNSSGIGKSSRRAFKDGASVAYTRFIMSSHTALNRVSRCLSGGKYALGQPRAAMSEVQICGIPKLSSWEVASTP